MESSGDEPESSWIASFCETRGHEFFCQVDRNYIEDGFNLYGLKGVVDNFGDCLDVILDRGDVHDDSEEAGVAARDAAALSSHVVELYGLVHARYVVTAHGLEAMHAKYARRDFGCCPRFYCDNYPVLPLGLNDSVGVEKVVLYCPRCRHVYRAPAAVPDAVDGAFFGTTFAHLFLMTFGFPRFPPEAQPPYVPRVFGFRLHRTAIDRAAQLRPGPRHADLPRTTDLAPAPAAPHVLTQHLLAGPRHSSPPRHPGGREHQQQQQPPPTAAAARAPTARKRPRLDDAPAPAPAAPRGEPHDLPR
mmetsp:Transcript_1169/g.2930  ORF Transcript_1169/g.2930 Transcript_1169/m.2930 type:complete len:303 (+) Transcript_1169:200-1108(+)